MCDVDVGRRMMFVSEERRVDEKERRKREKRTEITREEGEISGEKQLKIFCFFYNNAIVQFYL